MFVADDKRYDKMPYNKVGKWGLKLPSVSLGLWQNFSYSDNFENMENMCRTAFNLGINHFDLANITVIRITDQRKRTSARY